MVAERYARFLESLWSKAAVDAAPLLRESIALGPRIAGARVKTHGIEAALNSEEGRGAVKTFHNFYRAGRDERRVDELVDFGVLADFLGRIGVAAAGPRCPLESLAALRTSGEGIALAFSLSRAAPVFRKVSLYLWPRPGEDLDLLLCVLPAASAGLARGLLDRGGLLGVDLVPGSPGGTTLKVYVGEDAGLPDVAFDPRYARLWEPLRRAGFTQFKLKYCFAADGRAPAVEASYSVPLTNGAVVDLRAVAAVPELAPLRSFLDEAARTLEGASICSLGVKPGLRSLQVYFVFPGWVDMGLIL